MKIVAMVPARMGSERLKQKNLQLLGGKSIVSHALAKARDSKVFDAVYLNGDDPAFEKEALSENCNFYLRDQALGSSTTNSDDVVYDFINHIKCDAVAWVNSVSPLLTIDDIKTCITHFKNENLDSFIASRPAYQHAFVDNKPINFKIDQKFARTQDLSPVQLLNYSVMMWRSDTFIQHYNKVGFAMFCGKFGTCETSQLSSLLLKTQLDLDIIRSVYDQFKSKS